MAINILLVTWSGQSRWKNRTNKFKLIINIFWRKLTKKEDKTRFVHYQQVLKNKST